MLIESISLMPVRASVEEGNVPSESTSTFDGVMKQALHDSEKVHFSNHAQKRLDDRNISLSDQDVLRIAKSADDAMAKGSKEALLLMDRLALVVGVPNRTVITVMEPHERENTVFTNIDSVVVVAKDDPLS